MDSWGMSANIDIQNCDENTIRSKELIQDYVLQLCKLIEMKRFGDCQIVHFGSGSKEGFSMVQLIETSCITAHFANDSNSAFVDIFSCKEFDVQQVAIFTKDFFGGKSFSASAKNRYANNGD